MKKNLSIITICFLICAVLIILFSLGDKEEEKKIYFEKNSTLKPLDLKNKKFQDAYCKMDIVDIYDSIQVISKEGNTWFFDDIGCLSLWYKEIQNKDELKIFAYSRDTNKYINAKLAWYSLADETVMHYGFAAYEKREKNMINFNDMLLKMYRGENLTNPLIRKELLNN